MKIVNAIVAILLNFMPFFGLVSESVDDEEKNRITLLYQDGDVAAVRSIFSKISDENLGVDQTHSRESIIQNMVDEFHRYLAEGSLAQLCDMFDSGDITVEEHDDYRIYIFKYGAVNHAVEWFVMNANRQFFRLLCMSSKKKSAYSKVKALLWERCWIRLEYDKNPKHFSKSYFRILLSENLEKRSSIA